MQNRPTSTTFPVESTTMARPFVDRRNYEQPSEGHSGLERRQFTNSHDGLSEEGRELALAVDQYKLMHRRRFITYEEVLGIVKELGYVKKHD